MIKIAYFSAEIGISTSLPTYSGGLGVLAGDHLKASADAGLPMCAITLLYREGYFKQRIDEDGLQTETYPRFDPHPLLKKLPITLSLPMRGRQVKVQVYEYEYRGLTGHKLPIYFLDTDFEENVPDDQHITLRLYSGDKDHRILQEAILGFGGIRLLEELGLGDIETYHMNEGHCSFLTLELFRKFKGNREEVKKRCHFTTHTPVEAGHDHFSYQRCHNLIPDLLDENIALPSMVSGKRLHMTELGLYFSRSANGVSKLHGEVAREQFPWAKIDHITNGVYHPFWVGKLYREVYDRVLPGWRKDPEKLLELDRVNDDQLLFAHSGQKDFLLSYANSQTQKALSTKVLTIGFARRAASYKRARLLFSDPERLINLSQGQIQIVFSGKAHPNDGLGKELIREIVVNANQLFGKVKVVFLENYNIWLGRLITSGVDIWLNTPLRPNEASGTSGMKAALNGVPNLSILDGWWAEGCKDGLNGWSIGSADKANDEADADHLYTRLENDVIPTYYQDRSKWISLMRESIKTGVEFTTTRMIRDYNEHYYKINTK